MTNATAFHSPPSRCSQKLVWQPPFPVVRGQPLKRRHTMIAPIIPNPIRPITFTSQHAFGPSMKHYVKIPRSSKEMVPLKPLVHSRTSNDETQCSPPHSAESSSSSSQGVLDASRKPSRKKTTRACLCCSRAKTACDVYRPCARCKRKNIECVERPDNIRQCSTPQRSGAFETRGRARKRPAPRQRKRTLVACTACRKSKSRCDDGQPCSRCINSGRSHECRRSGNSSSSSSTTTNDEMRDQFSAPSA